MQDATRPCLFKATDPHTGSVELVLSEGDIVKLFSILQFARGAVSTLVSNLKNSESASDQTYVSNVVSLAMTIEDMYDHLTSVADPGTSSGNFH